MTVKLTYLRHCLATGGRGEIHFNVVVCDGYVIKCLILDLVPFLIRLKVSFVCTELFDARFKPVCVAEMLI